MVRRDAPPQTHSGDQQVGGLRRSLSSGRASRGPVGLIRSTVSVHPHATSIERRRRRPVREHAAHADLLGQHIEHGQRVAVAVDRRLHRLIVEAAALVERAGAFQRPADQY